MNRKLLVILVLIGIALIVAYRSRGWEFDWTLFFSTFRNVDIGWLLASLRPLKEITFDAVLGATLLGFSAIYVLGRPAELVRPVWLSRRENVPFSASVSTIVVERLLDFVMLALLFGTSLLFVQLPATFTDKENLLGLMKNAAWILLVGSIGAIIAMFFFRSNIDRIMPLIPFKRVASLLHNFAQGLSFLQQTRSFVLTVLHSLALWIMIVLQFWFLMLGMHFEFSVMAATLIMVFVAIGSIAQIPGIGGGFQAAFVFVLSTFFAVSTEKAVAASLIAWVMSYGPTVAIAAIYMMFTGLSVKDLRRLETT
jgi:glycosyltransferase 2 family protein